MRLKKLCESQCEDFALNLVTAFMKCKNMAKDQNFNLNLSETQMWFIFDIHIALLYKYQEKQKIVVLVRYFFYLSSNVVNQFTFLVERIDL